MIVDAVAALKALSRQAAEPTDTADTNELLAQARAIVHDSSLPASRGFGLGLLEAASAFVERGEPRAVEELFLKSGRMLEASGDAPIDDFLLLWRNSGALYEKHGALEQRNQTMALIGQVAENYAGPLEGRGADVFLDMALAYRRGHQVEAMLAMLRQVHRYRGSEAAPAADRLSWLQTYLQILIEAGRTDDAIALLSQAVELGEHLGDAETEASLLNTIALTHLSRQDNVRALSVLERARTVIDSTPALADTKLAVGVLHNLVGRLLALRTPSRYPEAIGLSDRTIRILRRLGLEESDDYAYAVYHRAILAEFTGDWAGAARGYSAAAAVPQARSVDATEWLALAGRAWFEVEAFGAASDCYLGAIRRQIAASV